MGSSTNLENWGYCCIQIHKPGMFSPQVIHHRANLSVQAVEAKKNIFKKTTHPKLLLDSSNDTARKLAPNPPEVFQMADFSVTATKLSL